MKHIKIQIVVDGCFQLQLDAIKGTFDPKMKSH